MEPSGIADTWASGDDYERYVGRWSRQVAPRFLDWLHVPPDLRWLDVGCGTGALTSAILNHASPAQVVGIDPSNDFVAHARAYIVDSRVSFQAGDAQTLPLETSAFDAVVSGLALNFVPEPARAIAEMARVVAHSGVVAAYIWDYTGEMQMMRLFWDAAIAVDPSAQALNEGPRFAAICHPHALMELFANSGLREVETTNIDIPTVFRDFDDYWTPFLGGQGSAPSYLASRTNNVREALRERLRATAPIAPDGSISLVARALAVRGSHL